MSIKIHDHGSGNVCRFDPEAFDDGAEIIIRGNGNTIEIGTDINLHAPKIHIEGNDNTMRFAMGSAEVADPIFEDTAPFILHLNERKPELAILGDRNTVEFGKKAEFYDSRMQIVGTDNLMRLGNWVRAHLKLDFRTDSAIFEMGDESTAVGMQAALHEPRSLRIGKDCQFAADVYLTVSDTHSIVDLQTGARINHGKDVLIGDHVWLCYKTIMLKGSTVGSGSVVGSGAVVSGTIPENCVAAGNPARVVRENVTWTRELADFPKIKAVG
jgi:acetyltransferase-like isoleucine patch superfamily enzyme